MLKKTRPAGKRGAQHTFFFMFMKEIYHPNL